MIAHTHSLYSHIIRAVVWFLQSVPLQNVLEELLVANGGVRVPP